VSAELAAHFHASAGWYREHWAPTLARLTGPLLDALPLFQSRIVVDVGAGTGALASALAAFAPESTIVGVDLVEGMIRLATPPMHRTVMNAQALALASDVADVAVSAFTLFFVPEPAVALTEIARVLRPGGTLGITTWGDEPDFPAMKIFEEELGAAGVGTVEPIRHDLLDTPERVVAVLEAAGYGGVRVWAIRQQIPSDAETFLDMLTRFGGVRRLATLEPPALQACLARVRTRYATLAPEDFTDPSEVVYATAHALS
jgi:SAM-dependent methyltransferase